MPPPRKYPWACTICGAECCPQSMGYRCQKHHRFQQMRKRSRESGKAVPSMEQLEAMANELVDMKCPVCKRKMAWLRPIDQRLTTVSIQHDHSGKLRLICLSCNARHKFFPDDSFYSEIGPDRMRCWMCREIKELQSFVRTGAVHAWRGRKSLCKLCSKKRLAPLNRKRKVKSSVRKTLTIAQSALLDVRDGTASYHDLEGSLERIVAILRGGLGDDA